MRVYTYYYGNGLPQVWNSNTVIDLIHENKASIQRGQKHLLRIHLMKCGVHVTKLF